VDQPAGGDPQAVARGENDLLRAQPSLGDGLGRAAGAQNAFDVSRIFNNAQERSTVYTALTTCHAISMGMMAVFSAPVAHFKANRNRSRLAWEFAFLRYSRNFAPVRPILGATSASQAHRPHASSVPPSPFASNEADDIMPPETPTIPLGTSTSQFFAHPVSTMTALCPRATRCAPPLGLEKISSG